VHICFTNSWIMSNNS